MNRPSVFILALLALLGAAGASVSAQAQEPAASGTTLFGPIASVLQHPRCINCHASAPFPRQKDAGIRHTQLVVRGADGHGTPALQCTACHQASNSADGKVPGAGIWHMPPLSMGWEGLTRAQICEAIKDPAKNGVLTLNELIDHVRSDPLVLWAWNPGAGRTTPALSHGEFVRHLEAWAAADGPCPRDDVPRSATP